MTDKKISQLPEGTITAEMIFPAVIGNSTYKVFFSDIVKSLGINGNINLGGVTSDIVNGGSVSNTHFLSKIASTCSLGSSQTGSLKFISAIDVATLNVIGGNGFTNISFTANQTALLIYIDAWYIISTNGVVS